MSLIVPESASDKRPSETKEPDVEILDPAVHVPIIEPRGDAAFKPPQPVAPLQANTTEDTPTLDQTFSRSGH